MSTNPPPTSVVTASSAESDGGVGATADARAFSAAALKATKAHSVQDSLEQLARAAVELVPCRWAVIAVLDAHLTVPARIRTATDPGLFETVLRVAMHAGTSPGWEAARHGEHRLATDLTSETGYGAWGAEMVRQTPIRACLAVPFPVYDDARSAGVLNLYSDRPGAFTDEHVARAWLLADHCALAIGRTAAADDAGGLQVALSHARTIGAAVGILIERHRLSYEQAFEQLCVASQNSNQKLFVVADNLVHTGAFPT